MNNLDTTALLVTCKLALVVTPILLCLCMPLAYWLARSTFRNKHLIEAACNLPMVLPPTVLGFGLLMVMSPGSPIGDAWKNVFGQPLPFSFIGLVIGSLFYSLPFGILPMRTAFEQIDNGIIEAAHCLGMTSLQTFLHVILPNARGGITASAALVFAHTVGEFGVALMIGGSIPGETRVASIAIFEHTETLNYNGAGLLSLVLMVISYAALIFIGRQGKTPLGRSTSTSASTLTDTSTTKEFTCSH